MVTVLPYSARWANAGWRGCSAIYVAEVQTIAHLEGHLLCTAVIEVISVDPPYALSHHPSLGVQDFLLFYRGGLS